MKTMNSKEFNQHTNTAKKEADKAPVLITNRGEYTHILMSYMDYQKLIQNQPQTLADWFMQTNAEVADIEMEIPKRSQTQRRTIEF
ncbi:type II toxin-antitoxin system Phd/YefM family antitoxin [Acinetobacter sp. 3657]|uniref:type II toxin-antitoxin system Phd/YefM family antitoxin n=1 Tax=Acinetobacter sp. 3657 TaxID=2817764 RepID=UPI00285A43DD|nr:PHD/YefM family antitoxin component YafN of YafNO toxin-antitoxin module [Prolinoborus sp. 3657]